MNLARLLVIDDAPAIVIFAKTHGTHHHTDIPGFTNIETGVTTCVRFEREHIPDPKDQVSIVTWLITKVQKVTGMTIEARPWNDASTIHIMRFQRPSTSTSDQPTAEAA